MALRSALISTFFSAFKLLLSTVIPILLVFSACATITPKVTAPPEIPTASIEVLLLSLAVTATSFLVAVKLLPLILTSLPPSVLTRP